MQHRGTTCEQQDIHTATRSKRNEWSHSMNETNPANECDSYVFIDEDEGTVQEWLSVIFYKIAGIESRVARIETNIKSVCASQKTPDVLNGDPEDDAATLRDLPKDSIILFYNEMTVFQKCGPDNWFSFMDGDEPSSYDLTREGPVRILYVPYDPGTH